MQWQQKNAGNLVGDVKTVFESSTLACTGVSDAYRNVRWCFQWNQPSLTLQPVYNTAVNAKLHEYIAQCTMTEISESH